MNTYLKPLFCCGLLFLCGLASSAQIPAVSGPGGRAITGEPYSADSETKISQTLADGTHIERTVAPTRTFRDSQGRTRVERYGRIDQANGGEAELTNVMINDPAAHVTYVLDPRTHTAQQLRPRGGAGTFQSGIAVSSPVVPARPVESGSGDSTAGSVASSERVHSRTTFENLGTQMMEGLTVDGTRATLTIPANEQGNDRSITVVTERWYSKDLQTYLVIKISDPRTGENTTTVANINRSEPDPGLFQVPSDYTIAQQ